MKSSYTGTSHILAVLEVKNKPFQILVMVLLIGAIGILDLITGYELAFSLFYVLPISLISWLTNCRIGIVASFASAFMWLCADLGSGSNYSSPFIPVWNVIIRFAFFVIISYLLCELKKVLQREAEMARIDYLTGAVNSRAFDDYLQREIDLLQRYKHPFTLAYFDLDKFKVLNDRLGHAVGDEVLCKVVGCVKTCSRKTDIVARIGGDEFAILLPETRRSTAETVLTRIQKCLAEEMQQNNWPITFSIGVVTCVTAPDSSEKLMKLADEVMYSVKHEGKNAVKFTIFRGERAENNEMKGFFDVSLK